MKSEVSLKSYQLFDIPIAALMRQINQSINQS
jgi:hypothetical protein